MRTIIILLLMGILFAACEDELEVLPENSLTLANALTTPQDFESALSGVEQCLKNSIIVNLPFLQETKGEYVDEIATWVKTDAPLLNNYNSMGIINYNTGPWKGYYDGIQWANVVLNQVDNASISTERKRLYKGQALFFKAMFYYRIVLRWGDCVLIKNNVIVEPVSKSPWDEVIAYAIELTREAVKYLPEFNEMTNWKGESYTHKAMPAKGAANALLAYLCAWQAGCKYFANNTDYDEQALWEEAESACTNIIKSGIYKLESNPELVCTRGLVENSPECIYETVNRGFEYELDWTGNGNLTSNVAQEMYMIGYPINPSIGINSVKDNTYRIRVSTVNEWYSSKDKRKEAYFYKPNELVEQTNGYACFYKYRKLWFEKNQGYMIGVNQNKVWWRLADIYLLRAECRARIGNKHGAIEDLNTIRERADAETYNDSENNGDLRYTIFLERQKELCFEGHRYFDVIRNGYVNTELLGDFKTLSIQDMRDGALFMCIQQDGDITAFKNNPLMRQNTYWFRRM